MTSFGDLQRKLTQTYMRNGKRLSDFGRDLTLMIERGFSREKAIIHLAVQNNIEIEEIRDMEKRGLSREEAILRFSEDLKRAEELSEIYAPSTPPKCRKYSNPSYLWYLLPLFLGFLGGLIAYVYVRDASPEMAKDLFTIGLVFGFIDVFLYAFILVSILF